MQIQAMQSMMQGGSAAGVGLGGMPIALVHDCTMFYIFSFSLTLLFVSTLQNAHAMVQPTNQPLSLEINPFDQPAVLQQSISIVNHIIT